MSNHFDPHSHDAMFTKLIYRIDQVESICREIRDVVHKDSARVTDLENDRKIRAVLRKNVFAGVVMLGGLAGWGIELLVQFLHK